MVIGFPLHKLLISYLSKKFNFFATSPLSIVFATTAECNSKCKTCFIWKHQDSRDKELNLDEYKRILQSMDEAYWVTLGGGEPFLRRDFTDILINICRSLKPKIVNIPSNGSRPDEIFYTIQQATCIYPEIQFTLNLSLDHIEKKHNLIRGMEGSFDLVRKTVSNLKSIKKSNFHLGIHTVISKYNLDDFPYIYHWIDRNIQPDSYIMENAQKREEFVNQGSDFFQNQHDYLEAIQFYLDKIKFKKTAGINRIKRALRIVYYNSIKESLISKKRFCDCYGGYLSCQVNADGEVWACATKRHVLGNLRQYNYDFRKLWRSKEAYEMRKKIKNEKCSCDLSNVFHTNILLNPKKMAAFFWNFLLN